MHIFLRPVTAHPTKVVSIIYDAIIKKMCTLELIIPKSFRKGRMNHSLLVQDGAPSDDSYSSIKYEELGNLTRTERRSIDMVMSHQQVTVDRSQRDNDKMCYEINNTNTN